MRRTFLQSKIHRATVTEADLEYEGSITIDQQLLDAAGIAEFEKVQVVDITNGARLETYAIPGEAGEIQINGAAAHLVEPGDLVIIMSFVELEGREIENFEPKIVMVDEHNSTQEHPTPAAVARALEHM